MNEQDKRVRDYYENLSMPKDKIDLLLQATEDAKVTRARAKHKKLLLPASWRSALARLQPHSWLQAALVCGFLLIVSLWMFPGSDSELSKRTFREVAMNHTTRLEPEFHGTSLAMLDNSMHQLPFNLALPESLDSTYELIGSRYCSLGGVLAAHVRLHNKQSGKPMSLFVTSNSAELEEIEPQQKKLEGVEVEIWREGGLFFALAQRS